MAHPRVYISNLSFEATENQLYEYLQDYNVVSVLIPSQTVRGLKSKAVRPFGIAYAEFSSDEEAKKAIQELSGKIFMERHLNLRMHIPIDSNKVQIVRKTSVAVVASSSAGANPSGSVNMTSTGTVPTTEPTPAAGLQGKPKSKKHKLAVFRRRKREEPTPISVDAVNDSEAQPQTVEEVTQETHESVVLESSQDPEPDVVAAEGHIEPVVTVDAINPGSDDSDNTHDVLLRTVERPASENIAFIGFIPRSTTDSQLREYFKDFEPQEIVVFKNRTYRRGFTFHRHFTAALVTFPDSYKLNDARQYASQEKFKGKQINVKNAFLEKVNEVKLALEKKTPSINEAHTSDSHEENADNCVAADSTAVDEASNAVVIPPSAEAQPVANAEAVSISDPTRADKNSETAAEPLNEQKVAISCTNPHIDAQQSVEQAA